MSLCRTNIDSTLVRFSFFPNRYLYTSAVRLTLCCPCISPTGPQVRQRRSHLIRYVARRLLDARIRRHPTTRYCPYHVAQVMLAHIQTELYLASLHTDNPSFGCSVIRVALYSESFPIYDVVARDCWTDNTSL